ncbi:NUDIX domain-containing protein [Patescibacteria group bacterium]|nr:NUDIX domain-containing protein [Patescibacteria group bacterium]
MKKPPRPSIHTPIPRKRYAQILNAVPIFTVDVLFLNKDKTKTLLFRRTNDPLKGVYFSAGGRLLKNEKILEGVARQARREAGIRVNTKKLILGGVQEESHQKSMFKGVSYHAVVLYYGYVIDEKTPVRLDNQHNASAWFPVRGRKLHPFIRKRLETLLKKS